MPHSPDISYFGITNNRSTRTCFGIRQEDRRLHLLTLGKTGTGKSTLLATLARQDIEADRGCAVIDPHGDLVASLLRELPTAARDRVIYLNPTDPTCPYGYNPVRRVREDKIALAASGLLETFQLQWKSAWGVRMEHVLRNSLYTLLERDGSTLPDLLRLYYDEPFREDVVRRVRNPLVRQFWRSEFDPLTVRQQAELIAPIQNKLGALLSDPVARRVLTPTSDLHFRTLMDRGAVILVNLSRGQLGDDTSATLGSLLVSTIGLAAFSRADAPQGTRRPFYLYVDEFQHFTTHTFASMISELRKTGVGLVLASQTLQGLSQDVRHAVLGNVGTLVSFRVGPEDAGTIAKEFHPAIGVTDLLNLANYSMYLKLMIDGAPSKPFSAWSIEGAVPTMRV